MTEAFGRPVTGEINQAASAKEQAPEEDFLPALDALLDTPGIEAVRWEQYTPYFNDGDPCVFGVGEVRVKIAGHEEGGDYDNGFLTTYDTHTYEYVRDEYGQIDYSKTKEIPVEFDGISTEEFKAAVKKFEHEIGYGRHNVLLAREFGDHAQVTATKDGFNVEYYEHD
jgi:hypothetical protein